ncbi:hypothetical protein [Lysinibacter cavernae]|uniref:Magnesium-transporting ATPase (P-type) n=1 Tax=Lysinibacter cavernae TaxID=1640652 RepID=A0A7X5R443_9MICO|nr:hypothetical protein [Lysinibacter cavernae]NIH55324.1 magnesium-transporting ATPase (P-type) [Lysinibacter cavernae]
MTDTTPAQPAPDDQPVDVEQLPRVVPSSQPILRRALILGSYVGLGVIAVMSVIGWLWDGSTGLLSAALGSVSALVLLAITVVSILVSNRFVKSDLYVVWFFALVLGSWLVKFALFIVLTIVVRDQDWLNGQIFFLSVLAGVLASLVTDVIVVTKNRVPYVGDLGQGRRV